MSWYTIYMNGTSQKNDITLDDLAAMVANGFSDIVDRMATKEDIARLDTRVTALDTKITTLDAKVTALDTKVTALDAKVDGLQSSVNNYLRLSDERYLELKHRQDVIVKWVTKLAEQNHVTIDLQELDYK